MTKAKKFLKSSFIYFVGNILTKIISFFLLPMYTNYIPTGGMGYYDVINTYMNIIVPIVSVTIWAAILRYCFDFENRDDKYKVIFNAMFALFGSVIVYSIAAIILGFVGSIKYLLLIYLMGIAMMLQNCYSNMVRALGYNVTFAASGVVGGLVNCGSNVVMILFLHMQEESLFIALTLGLFAQVVVMESKVKFLRHISFQLYNKRLLVNMLRYSFPLALNSTCFWFLSSYDKIGISRILGLEANGIYSIAGKYTYIVGLVSDCFALAMQEMLYSMGNQKEGKTEFYTITSNYYIKFLMYGLLLLLPFVYFTFPILIGKGYSAAFPLIPIYLLATVENVYSGFLGDIFAAEKKTTAVFYSTVVAAGVNVAVFHLLVGTMGVQAANIALTLGFLANIIIRIIILRKEFPLTIDYKMFLFTLILFVAGSWIYFTQGKLVNLIWLIAILVLTIYEFRDIIKRMTAAIRAKILQIKN